MTHPEINHDGFTQQVQQSKGSIPGFFYGCYYLTLAKWLHPAKHQLAREAMDILNKKH